MAEARLTVQFAGPLVSVQDAGRPGHLRFGVPASGPMDRLAYLAGHAALGVQPAAGIEVSLGGVILRCVAGPVTVAVTGGGFEVEHGGVKSTSNIVLTLHEGQNLSVRAGAAGSWAYIAFAGLLETETWLGQAATHGGSGFGGGFLTSGQALLVRQAEAVSEREGSVAAMTEEGGPIRVVVGPQDQHFAPGAVSDFLAETFHVSDGYDRMGMRLRGPGLALAEALSIPSEPILRGSVQVSGDGAATVLLADHQTTGGYPKIATVIGPDLDRLVQMRSGQALRFAAITPAEAVALARVRAAQMQRHLAQITVPRGTLAQRLMRENLIDGVIDAGGERGP